jgi:hypothetical protein
MRAAPIISLLTLVGAAWAQDQPAPAGTSVPVAPIDYLDRKGIALGMFTSHPDDSYAQMLYRQMLEEIAALGATDVQLTTRWVQRDITSTTIRPVPGVTPSDATLKATIAHARHLKLRVFLLPIIHLEKRSPKEWRGTLRPADPAAWWASHRAFILHHARLAPDAVDLLAVGSELVSMERDEGQWRQLIADVRAVFKGKLTYSANWDHYLPVRFWDALDVIGVSAYWPIAKTPADDVATMVARWRPIRAELGRFAKRKRMPFIFTELGYRSDDLGAVEPWLHTRKVPARPDIQARAWQATRMAWDGTRFLSGFYAWNWFGMGGPTDTSHNPREKPAAQVLSRWFRGQPPVASPKNPSSTAR